MPQPGANLLLIDPDPENTSSISSCLKTAGYSIQVCGDPVEALSKAQQSSPALIVLHAIAPSFAEMSLCQKLLSAPQTRHIPIMLVIQGNQVEKVIQAFSLGLTDFISTPINHTDLVTRIQVCLGRAHKTCSPSDQACQPSPQVFRTPDPSPSMPMPDPAQTSTPEHLAHLREANSRLREDLSDHVQKESSLRESLQQAQLLLREIHHRVKNNLQVIESLLGLQMHQHSDPHTKELFQSTRFRVHAMALVHEQLYKQQTQGSLELEPYLRLIVQHLQSSLHSDTTTVEIHVQARNIALPLHRAIPCGLLVTELVSNCFKHAFSSATRGIISVQVTNPESTHCCLQVHDDGAGIPPNLDIRATSTLGMQLIVALVEHQLGGTITIDRRSGTGFTISFPIEESQTPPQPSQ